MPVAQMDKVSLPGVSEASPKCLCQPCTLDLCPASWRSLPGPGGRAAIPLQLGPSALAPGSWP